MSHEAKGKQIDIVVYSGDVTSAGYRQLSDAIEQHGNRDSRAVFFIPITNGGDPNAGYRIARSLGHYYPDSVKIGIPSICKSAGTLMCIGGSELVVADRGELGPLDIQLSSKDELFGLSSGLDIMQALTALQDTMSSAFKSYLYDLKFGGRLGTKVASDIASNLAIGLITPIAQQIDPVKLGEHQRAMQIAIAYGDRLNAKFQNTSREKIERLLTSYPAHGFVIDRKEVKELFNKVRCPNEDEAKIFELIRKFNLDVPSGTVRCFVESMDRILEMVAQDLDTQNIAAGVENVSNHESQECIDDREAAGTVPTRATGRAKRQRRSAGGGKQDLPDSDGADQNANA